VQERALQALVRSAGATWDSQAKLWRMSIKKARALDLHERIVKGG
jgi:hypothetical protein